MAIYQTPAAPVAQASPVAPKQLHRALWTSVLLFFLRMLPQGLCVWLNAPVAAVIFVLAGTQRRAVIANLSALNPQKHRLWHWRAALRVFQEFGLTYMDRLWHLHFGLPVEWRVDGMEHFEALRDENGGAMVFTVHAGNYDIGSAIFASKLGREFHTVRAPEQTAGLDDIRAAELAGQEDAHPLLRVHYNANANHLGLELCRLLQAGKIVAIQGDRVVQDVSPMQVRLGALEFRVPRGPLVLAQLTRMPCYAVFLHRTGVLAYHVEVHPPFCTRGEEWPLDELAARWLAVMNGFIRRHWHQWFVFEPLVSRSEP